MQIRFLSDSIQLREYYAMHEKRVLKDYHRGSLVEKLRASSICDDTIADFLLFLEQETAKKEIVNSLSYRKK